MYVLYVLFIHKKHHERETRQEYFTAFIVFFEGVAVGYRNTYPLEKQLRSSQGYDGTLVTISDGSVKSFSSYNP